ncbi:MAG TPA: class I SAM-dependent rRNA methyltransferase [Steroidobacteraceae bacterium]|nr:class I SAM-dependent rRNA methyltransferase [Steroidobacteraceae bacterium]HNS27977.1 class I SAM-dependent rRNA methyltransferase [Steroidobacteraceae bacterium]
MLLRLKKGEDRRLRAGHSWVFSNEVDTGATPLSAFTPDLTARIVSDRDAFLGYGYVNPHALISARLLSRDERREPDGALLASRIARALRLRERLHPTPHYRLVFGESDELPGLIVDRYGDIAVGQIATAGMEARRPAIEAAIREVVAPRTLVWKNDTGARDLEQLPKEITVAFGELPEELAVIENGIEFAVPFAQAQKTGWFYDQAANRARLRELLPRDARVLDVCSYAGAWAVTALKSGARAAACVDASAGALQAAGRNAARHDHALETLQGDAFDVLESLAAAGRRFDAIVLDPPAFAKRRKDLPKAQAAYRKLNQLALRLLDEEGLLVSCSCSWHLAESDLLAAIQAAARHVSRFVQVLAVGGQAPDHPLHPAIPETRYLKAFFCRVLSGQAPTT